MVRCALLKLRVTPAVRPNTARQISISLASEPLVVDPLIGAVFPNCDQRTVDLPPQWTPFWKDDFGLSDNEQANTRAGFTLALPVDRNNSLKLSASTNITTRTGSEFSAVGVAWQYRWGGGY
jgi:hypothetical protein